MPGVHTPDSTFRSQGRVRDDDECYDEFSGGWDHVQEGSQAGLSQVEEGDSLFRREKRLVVRLIWSAAGDEIADRSGEKGVARWFFR